MKPALFPVSSHAPFDPVPDDFETTTFENTGESREYADDHS
ncbi:hypothetical protein CGMCC3_g1042 [Colletotrichum fructicola]|nr:uncharacterized protein CGMCC3_g1042 [Colletotrichum fructicola]KAE9583188.1 hypothetical protein CGMCC3_g1042 [Colletotrichum fructicola]